MWNCGRSINRPRPGQYRRCWTGWTSTAGTIALSPLCVLSSSNARGQADASPRGDPPGFVKVLDEQTLLLPDRPGNNQVDSLQNIVENPGVGLLFFVPGMETLRVKGKAEITTNEELLEPLTVLGKAPRSGLKIAVEEVFRHCGRALIRSRIWDPEVQIDRSSYPTYGQVLADQIAGADSQQIDADELRPIGSGCTDLFPVRLPLPAVPATRVVTVHCNLRFSRETCDDRQVQGDRIPLRWVLEQACPDPPGLFGVAEVPQWAHFPGANRSVTVPRVRVSVLRSTRRKPCTPEQHSRKGYSRHRPSRSPNPSQSVARIWLPIQGGHRHLKHWAGQNRPRRDRFSLAGQDAVETLHGFLQILIGQRWAHIHMHRARQPVQRPWTHVPCILNVPLCSRPW